MHRRLLETNFVLRIVFFMTQTDMTQKKKLKRINNYEGVFYKNTGEAR